MLPQAYKRVPLLLLISAPSGAGKTTLCYNLLNQVQGLTRAITCTTRPPRKGEINGQDYYFLDETTFINHVKNGDFIEHAVVYGHHYGLLRSELISKLSSGYDVLLNVDVQGAATIREKARTDPTLSRALVTIFMCPPSLAELERRIKNRGTDSEQVIHLRLNQAKNEMTRWVEFDYLLISGTMEEDVQRVIAIMQAERMRTSRIKSLEL